MAATIDATENSEFAQDRLSGSSRTRILDRWIYVLTTTIFIGVVLAGFVPDSVDKVAAIYAHQRLPFPLILHLHAVLMGSFLLLLLGQACLVATDKRAWHMRLGIFAAVLVPAIVISGFILVPTMYHNAWESAQSAPISVRQQLQNTLPGLDNLFLVQLRAGLLFSTFMWIALRFRASDPGLHKRMILLAVAAVLGAATLRIHWLPTTIPKSPLAPDIYTLLTLGPLFVWDLIRNRSLHRAYLIWAIFYLPVTAMVYLCWNTPWWHTTVRHMMGV